jgi:hypothetical protein
VTDDGRAARRLAATSANAQVWEFPGSGEGTGLSTAPAAWERRVVGFFDRALRPRRP